MMSTVIVICETNPDCVDPNTNRWYCLRGHYGAPADICPLAKCNREAVGTLAQSD